MVFQLPQLDKADTPERERHLDTLWKRDPNSPTRKQREYATRMANRASAALTILHRRQRAVRIAVSIVGGA